MEKRRVVNDLGRLVDPDNIGRRGRRWVTAKAEAFRIRGTNCWWCGHPGGLEGDHLIRLADGGAPYDPDNIVPSHGSNYPCPVCVGERTGRPRCCNQERNRRERGRQPIININPSDL